MDYGISEGVKGLSSSLDASRDASKSLSKSIENIQQDGLDVAQQQAKERLRLRREAEFKKERALIKALDSWKHKKQISDEEAKLKIDFVKKYGAKEWEAVIKIKLDIENMQRKDNEEFQHDLKAVRRVQVWCFVAALMVTLWLKFVLGAFLMFPLGAILDIGGKILDKVFPDPAQAEQAKLKLLEMQQNGELAQIAADTAEQQELTKRQQADMASDSTLSKNIRPMTLVFILVVYSTFAMMSAFDVEVNNNYVELLGQWGMLIMSFYFGGRTLEKIMDMKTNGK